MDQPRDLLEPMTRTAWGRIVQIQDGVARIALGAYNPNEPHAGVLTCELPPELGKVEVDRFVEVLLDAPPPSGQWKRGDIDTPMAFGVVRQVLAVGDAFTFEGTLVANNNLGSFYDAQGQICRAPPVEDQEFLDRDRPTRKLRATGINRSRSQVTVRLEMDAAQTAAVAERRRRRTATFSVNERVSGRLKSVSKIGIFVELSTPHGKIDGLIRRAEASWDVSANLEELVDSVRPVQALVLAIPDTGAIELSIRALTQSPWERFGADIHVGDQFEGVVKHIMEYGAFVRILPELDALAHISDFSPPLSSGEVGRHFTVGQKVRAEVVAINADKKRINVAIQLAPEADKYMPADDSQ